MGGFHMLSILALFIGATFGFSISAILSARAYDKGYSDAKGGVGDE